MLADIQASVARADWMQADLTQAHDLERALGGLLSGAQFGRELAWAVRAPSFSDPEFLSGLSIISRSVSEVAMPCSPCTSIAPLELAVDHQVVDQVRRRAEPTQPVRPSCPTRVRSCLPVWPSIAVPR